MALNPVSCLEVAYSVGGARALPGRKLPGIGCATLGVAKALMSRAVGALAVASRYSNAALEKTV